MLPLIALATALLSATHVYAHGYVQEIQISGKQFSGYLPWEDPYVTPTPKRIVRKIPGDGPITSATDDALNCNEGGENGANTVADINAGDDISITWNVWPSDHAGPITLMMADCNGDCKSFSANDAKWFKIAQDGWSEGKWATDRFIEDGAKFTSTIPSQLANGQYLIRMEIVALHSTGAPQYYPSCAQLNVKNGGGKSPSGNELVSIPGLYDGYKWPDIWSRTDFSNFKVAGPSVVSFASSGGNSGSSGNNEKEEESSGSSKTSKEASPESTPSPSTSRSSNDYAPSPSPAVTLTSTSSDSASTEASSSKGSCRRKRSLSNTRLSKRKGGHLDRFARHGAHKRSH